MKRVVRRYFAAVLEAAGLVVGCHTGRAEESKRNQVRANLDIWDRLRADLLRLLRQAGKLDTDLAVIDNVYVRAFGVDERTGPARLTAANPGRSTRSWSAAPASRLLLGWLGVEPQIASGAPRTAAGWAGSDGWSSGR